MFKDNTQFRERFNRWKNGEQVYDKGRPIDPPEVELPTVVVTPDYEYNQYLGTLPANQRLADESEYRQHRYWELNGKPKNFKEAVSKGMFDFNKTDNLWHAGSVAWNDSIKGYEFMKPKTHPTTYMEIDAYNSDEMSDFRKQFELEDNPNLEYYRYLPRYPQYRNGKDAIHINPRKRGTFTKAAKAHGMSVQGFASKVLANKDNYSSAMVKKANFARNARRFKH